MRDRTVISRQGKPTAVHRKNAPRAARRPSKLHDPTELSDGELRKSSDTRRRIMESAVHCLASFGYAGVNAASVAEHTGLTRPAMLYHFPTRLALIEAAIHYVTRQRIDAFENAVVHVAARRESLEHAVVMAWQQNDGPLYQAYCELANAARTDPDLHAIFGPAMIAYDRARRESARQLFSEEQQAKECFHLRRDAIRFLLDGMASHGAWIENRHPRLETLLRFAVALTVEPEAEALLCRAAASVKSGGPSALPRRRRAKKDN